MSFTSTTKQLEVNVEQGKQQVILTKKSQWFYCVSKSMLTSENKENIMPAEHEILCVRKSDRYNPHERITHIGGRNADGTRWEITQEEAIKGIDNRQWAFFVQQSYQRVRVIVAVSRYGNKYLKTEADGEQPNNLLSLVECPVVY